MDWSSIISAAAQTGAALAANVVLPGALAWAARRWNLNTQWTGAVEQAAGAAYAAAVATGKPVTDPAAREAALSAGVGYLQAQVKPAVLAAAGVTTGAAVTAAVEAGLGRLLAQDPTVGTGGAGQQGAQPAAAAA